MPIDLIEIGKRLEYACEGLAAPHHEAVTAKAKELVGVLVEELPWASPLMEALDKLVSIVADVHEAIDAHFLKLTTPDHLGNPPVLSQPLPAAVEPSPGDTSSTAETPPDAGAPATVEPPAPVAPAESPATTPAPEEVSGAPESTPAAPPSPAPPTEPAPPAATPSEVQP